MKRKILMAVLTLALALCTIGLLGCKDSHTHSYSSEITSPTCTEQGYATYTCECGDSYIGDYVDPLGHDKVNHIAKAPTCTGTGYSAYDTCTRCEFSTYNELSALGHEFTNYVSNNDATFDNDGTKTALCENDGCIVTDTITDVGSKLSHIHNYASVVTEPTCTGQGYATYTCECGDSYNDDYVDSLGHDIINHLAKEPTCIKTGYNAYATCSRCDYSTYAEIPALGHDKVSHEAKAPTCIETGYNVYDACTRCDYSTYAEIPALGHDKVSHEAKAPTCTEKGYDVYDACTRCDYSTYDEIPALGHDKVSHEAKAPTCTEKGYNIYDACTRCDYSTYSEIPATGHGYSKVVTEPTCTERGYTTYTCNCGDSYVGDYVPANHNYVDNVCTLCKQPKPTDGLSYKLSDDETYYICTGIGSASVKDIVIADFYNHLPVSAIDTQAFQNCSSLTSVIFGNKLISVGKSAFSGCTSLTSINISESITSVGLYAFSGCTRLTEINFNATAMKDLLSRNYVFNNAGENGDGITVTIGANVTKIPAYLFYPYNSSYYSPKITNVMFKDNSECESIGTGAFSLCNSLTSINIPNSVTSIGDGAFSGCDSLQYNVYDNAKYLGNESNPYLCLMDFVDASITNCEIYPNTKIIYHYAFSGCENLTRINIPDSVTSIGDWVFYICSNLTSVTIGDGVTSIGFGAFEGCESLEKVNYTGTIDKWVMIDFKGDGANPLGHGLDLYINDSLVTQANITTATYINNKVFISCTSLKKVIIGYNVTRIGNESFSGCDKLTSVVIGSGVTSIGDGAFFGCSNLTSINIPDSVTSIGDGAFYYCSRITSITIGERVTSIGDDAFFSCKNLTSINIPDDVVSIGDRAFYNCSNLTSVTIGDGVTSIGFGAFEGCKNLTDVVIGKNVVSIGDSAFRSCCLTSINIPDSVTFIGDGAFSSCDSLQYNVYDNAKYLGNENNPHLWLMGVVDGSITHCEVNPNTKFIGYNAFSGCSNLTSVTIGKSVVYIGERAFEDCTGLMEINFNATAMNDVTLGNGDDRFYNAGKNREGITVKIGANVTKIPACLFYPSMGDSSYSPKLISVLFEENSVCESIGAYAFYNCSSLMSINIPNTVISIGEYAFYGCTGLTTITIPDSVTKIGALAFYNCSSLTSATIGKNVTSIGERAFSYCSNLTKIIIPDSVTNVGDYAFYNCSSLTSATIGKNVMSIGESAFYCCSKLESIIIGNGVTNIYYYAFYGCSSLTSIIYNGTKNQWNAISKRADWDYRTGSYSVQCTDGVIAKS